MGIPKEMNRESDQTAKEGVPGAQAIGKAFQVLRCVASAPEGLPVVEVAKLVGMPRTTVVRLLSALEAERLIWADSTEGVYRVGPGLLELVGGYLASHDVRRIAKPFLRELALSSGETVNLAITDGTDSICIEQIESSQAVRAVNWIGKRLPLHATATGKAWLAYQPEAIVTDILCKTSDASGSLPASTDRTITNIEALREDLAQTRERGYAIADGELESALAAVAAPVVDHDGTVAATLAVSGPNFRVRPEHLPELGMLSVRVAADISTMLGSTAPPRRGGTK